MRIGLENNDYFRAYAGETFGKVEHLGHIDEIIEVLEQYNPEDIEKIFLRGNHLKAEDIEHLCRYLSERNFSNLCVLDLGNNPAFVDWDDIKSLCEDSLFLLIQKVSSLRYIVVNNLWTTDCNLLNEKLEDIEDFYEAYKKLSDGTQVTVVFLDIFTIQNLFQKSPEFFENQSFLKLKNQRMFYNNCVPSFFSKDKIEAQSMPTKVKQRKRSNSF